MTPRQNRADRGRREQPLASPVQPRREVRCAVCGAEFLSREQLDEHERQEHRKP